MPTSDTRALPFTVSTTALIHGRQETPDGLRGDDVEQPLPEAEADRLAGLGLSDVDGLDGTARDLDDVRGLERGQREYHRREIAQVDLEERAGRSR